MLTHPKVPSQKALSFVLSLTQAYSCAVLFYTLREESTKEELSPLIAQSSTAFRTTEEKKIQGNYGLYVQ